MSTVEFLQALLQLLEGFRAMVIARHVCQRLDKILAPIDSRRTGIGQLLDGIHGGFLKILVRHGSAGKSNNRETPGQAMLCRQTIQRRHQFAPREIAGSAENYDRARIGR